MQSSWRVSRHVFLWNFFVSPYTNIEYCFLNSVMMALVQGLHRDAVHIGEGWVIRFSKQKAQQQRMIF